MARRKDHTREQLKDISILEARKLIINKGYNGFSIREVAKQIGYTVGTLYQIFKNMDDLLLHVNAITLIEINKYLLSSIEKAKDKPLALALAYYSFAEQNKNLFFCLFEHKLQGGDDELPKWYQSIMEEPFKLAAETFKKGTKEDKADTASLWAAVHGITVLSLSGKLDTVKASKAEMLIKNVVSKFF